MHKKNEKNTCAVCGKLFPTRDLVPGEAVRDAVAKEIVKNYPDWLPESFICKPDLTQIQEIQLDLLSELGRTK